MITDPAVREIMAQLSATSARAKQIEARVFTSRLAVNIPTNIEQCIAAYAVRHRITQARGRAPDPHRRHHCNKGASRMNPDTKQLLADVWFTSKMIMKVGAFFASVCMLFVAYWVATP